MAEFTPTGAIGSIPERLAAREGPDGLDQWCTQNSATNPGLTQIEWTSGG